MPEYRQVVVGGNQGAANAFRLSFGGADQSDIPQLTAWDNENLNSIAIEQIAGFLANSNQSMIAAASTNGGNAATANGWATGLAQTPGGAVANRLRGNESFVLLGTSPPVGPFPVHRTFQYAVGCHASSSPGSVGYQPCIAVKMFHTGAPPTVTWSYNEGGSDGSPNWVAMNDSPKGTPLPIGVKTAIIGTGPDTVGGTSNDGVIDAVTKPGSGEKWAEEIWVRTL